MSKERTSIGQKEKSSAEENKKEALEQIKTAEDRYGKDIYDYCHKLLPAEANAQMAKDIVFRKLLYSKRLVNEMRLKEDLYETSFDIPTRLRNLAEDVCKDIQKVLEFKEKIYKECCKFFFNKKDAQNATDVVIRSYVYKKKKSGDIFQQLKILADGICDDILLVTKFRSGDRGAYYQLFIKHYKKIYNLCFRILPKREVTDHRSDAEDMVADVYVKGFVKFFQLTKPASFYSWISTIASRECINKIKKTNRTEKNIRKIAHDENECEYEESDSSVDPPGTNPQEIMINTETEKQANEAIEKLPDNYRIAIILFYYEDMSHKEIEELMGCNVGQSKLWVHRGLKKLRELLI